MASRRKDPLSVITIQFRLYYCSDYVFFYSYVHISAEAHSYWSQDEELCRVNGDLLRNFIAALSLASIEPRGFLLQTGGKSYQSVSHVLSTPFPLPLETKFRQRPLRPLQGTFGRMATPSNISPQFLPHPRRYFMGLLWKNRHSVERDNANG